MSARALCTFTLPLLLSALIGVVPHTQAARTELDLGGTWQYQKVSQLSFPPSNSWQTVTVPGYLTGWQYEHAWFRCVFTPPAAMAGTQLKLRFGGAKFNARVWLNGAFIGRYLNGYEPFEFDVTTAAQVGQTNELVVGVTDWTATFSTNVDFSNLQPYENPRDHAKNAILAPIGGRYDLYGLWQPVKLVSLPAVSIADVFVMPSVRTQQLTVRLTLRNDTATTQTAYITNRVLDGSQTALVLPASQITLAPGATSLDVTAPWPTAHWWSHLDPYLYSLETTVASGGGQDQIRTRFGFREFWATNGLFFLNGIPINLPATATWPTADLQSSNQISKTLLDVKAGNNVAMRLHTQPWDEAWYDIADQIGLLLVEECAVWCDPSAYRLADPVFWTNYAQHVTAAVARDRNHPSIVLWSLENEILHCGGKGIFSATDTQLAALGSLVKTLDPTRPITYEADLDPGGQADALGLHYPHEYPDYQLWPNAAWWMDQSIARAWVPGGQWKWDHTKPLYIGEFLWVPSTSAADFTILFGDDAYVDPSGCRNLAKGLTWRMQIEAYRAYGVNGIGPWTMFEDPAGSGTDLNSTQNYLYQVQKAAYEPNGAFFEEYNPRFFTGDTVQRTVHLFNDRTATNNLTLSWNAGGAWQSRQVTLPPAGQWRGTISFPVPATAGPFNLQLQVSNGVALVFTNSFACSAQARPNLSLPAATRLGLYDPFGTTSNLLGRFNLSFTNIADLRTAAYSQFDLLVIGQNVLTNETILEVGKSGIAGLWRDFAQNGGWVLLLEQTNYPSWLPVQLRDFDATFAFPNSGHPAMAGLTADDLRWWAGDHRVVAKSLGIPAGGNFRPLAAIGSRQGLEYAAAVEVPIGKGGFLCSQFLLAQRFDLEPIAGVILQRFLNCCAPGSAHPTYRPAALCTETNSPAAAVLAGLGLQSENFSGRLADCDPALYPVLVVAGSNALWQEAALQLTNLASYVERGGNLVLHRPNSAFLAAAQPVLFPDLDPADLVLGQVFRRDSTNAAVRLLNHDLYWIDQAGDWNRPELLSTNIARRYYRKRFNLTTYGVMSAAGMPIHSTGGAGSGGWWLYMNGYVATNITVTQPGTYLFNISASGTPALGGWPQMSLKIDGKTWDSIIVPTNSTAWYTLSADLTAGTHQLALSFDNDAWNPPNEDRNLWLGQVLWGRDVDTSPTTLLTRPGAVAQVRRGNGAIVLDEIMWDTASQNTTKSGRYISTLLTGLGAAMPLPLTLALDPQMLTNVNVAAYSLGNGIVWLGSNGRIQTSVRFTAQGNYTFDVVAGGTAAQGVLPQIAIVVDGVNRTNFFLTSTAMTHYQVTLSLTAGVHSIGLAFLNDYYAPPEDRNAAFGRLTIIPQAAPQITNLQTDPIRRAATLQWQAVPGKRYEVQTVPDLAGLAWYAVTNFVGNDNTLSWRDIGDLSNAPPLGPDSPRRFYRIRQVGP